MANKKNVRTSKADTDFNKKKEEQSDVKDLAKGDNLKKVLGVVCIAISVILLFAFSSYLFTWRADQSEVVNNGFGYLFTENSKEATNMLGRFGAVVAHFFMYNTFGVAAFLFITFFFIAGINLLFQHKFYSLLKNVKFILIWASATSIILAYFFNADAQFWGGAFGHLISGWLIRFIGFIGAGLVIFFAIAAFLVWYYNPSFSKFKQYLNDDEEAAISFDEQPNGKRRTVAVENNLDYEAQRMKDMGDNEAQVAVANEFADKRNRLKDANGVVVLSPDADQDGMPELELIVKNENEENNPLHITPLNEDDADGSIFIDTPTNTHPFEIVTPQKKEKFVPEEELSLEINTKPIETNIEADAQVEAAQTPGSVNTQYDPMLDLADYKYPILDLMEIHGSERIVQDATELEANKNQIISTLRNYDIEIQKIMATVGPTVTLYEIVPAPGVRISKIKNLEDDIALSLAALGIRIIAPIPGKGTIGIEVPNIKNTIVSMRSLLNSEKFQKNNFSLPIALGKKIDNENFIVDLATMPHLLMAGATGQGKSVGLNAVLVSLLYKKHPAQLKLVLVDPKKVELSLYTHIEKHFLAKLPGEDESIITDTKKVVHTLNALCIEMDNRYDLLKEAGCRNIKEYNEKFVARRLNPEKGHQYLPFIVLVIDEFADLIMTAGKEVETPIARLAQLARAIGIHLIIATQRPSVNIITGTIKANFPARIAFKVSSKIDSRTILDTGGAEQLIGKGDMLISYNGELTRLQCAFVDTPEVDKVVEFIGQQRGYPEAFMLPEYNDENDGTGKNFSVEDKDSLFDDAARLIVASQSGSTSLIQRKLKLGYNRAGRVMDQLESAGIVGPAQGSKPRDVYVKTDADLMEILSGLG